MDGLALALQHPGDRILGQPVDLEVRNERAQLLRDGDVTLGVAEADRGGDEEGALHCPPTISRQRPPVQAMRLAGSVENDTSR